MGGGEEEVGNIRWAPLMARSISRKSSAEHDTGLVRASASVIVPIAACKGVVAG